MCNACDWAPHFASFGAGAAHPAAAAAADPVVKPAGHPDVVFHNGRVYTVAGPNPWAQAVAITGATITHVGADNGVLATAGPTTRLVDLGGRLLLPGFVEGHIHPILGAFLSNGVDLQVPTEDDALAAIAEYARAHPDGPVRGFGWRVDMFGPDGPTRQALDRVLPDRPGFFFAIDAHSMWVNSMALELAGIDRESPDPVPGFSYYVRDADGDPTGYLLEIDAVLGLVNSVDPITATGLQRMLEDWLPKAAEAGITAVFDAGVPPVGGGQADIIALYANLERTGALPFRVVASYAVKSPPFDDAVAEFTAARGRVSTDLVQVGMVKIVGDGTQGGYTAWLIEPYADKPESIGCSPFTEQQWHQMVDEIDAAGIDMHIHACGERTARVALDALEAAIAKNPARDRRHTIAHLVYLADDDSQRFGQHGIGAQFSANWFSADPDTVVTTAARYGAPRKHDFFRIQDVLWTGGRVSLGTDWPAAGYFSTYKPLDAIQIGVTRQLIGPPGAEVLSPADQRLTVAEAVHANTMGAAQQIRLEDKVGSIEVGKMADLIVLDRNIFEIDPHDIHRAQVLLTMMDGTVRHDTGEL